MSDKILTRVRGLLAKAEDRATPPEEAETYTAKAAELMAKYGIDRAMLAAADPTSDIVGDRVVTIEGSYAIDKQRLLGQVAVRLGCRAVYRAGWRNGRRTYQVHLFGYGADLERVEILFTSLLVQAANGMATAEVPYRENATAYRKTWLQGFTVAITDRLRRTEQRAQEQATPNSGGPSVALVLASRAGQVGAALNRSYPKLKTTPTRRLHGSGTSDGYVAGQRADLGGTRIGNRSSRAVNA